MVKSKKILGEFLVILSGILWGCIGIFTRKLTDCGFSSFQIGFIRALLTAVFVFIVILIKDVKLLKFDLKDIWMFFGTGVISFAALTVFYMSSIVENSLSVACVLMYTSPIWVTLISTFVFKEKLNLIKIISISTCFLGCVAICFSSTVKITWFGLFLGIMSGITYALYSIFGKVASKKYSPLTITFYAFLLASLALLPLCNIGDLFTKVTTQTIGIWYSLGIAVACTILPFLLYTIGLSLIDASKAAVFSIVDPVVAAIVGAIAFKEKIGLLCVVGMLIIFAGLLLQSKGEEWFNKKGDKKDEYLEENSG